jgi:DNA polymerase-3 subunit delta'
MTALLPWQQSQWDHIVKRIQKDTMPHALLLNGAEGIGKQRFAEHLAAAITCQSSIADAPCGMCKSCSLQQAGTHPDIILITPEEKGKAIKIDAIRDLIEMSGKTTQNGKQRVVIISPAEAMNRAAANALLKTLEEPVPSTQILMVTHALKRLPATILSRCQRLDFRQIPNEMASEWLESQLDASLASQAFTGGAPLLALENSERVAAASERLQNLLQVAQRAANPVSIAENWSSEENSVVFDDLSRIFADLTRYLATGVEDFRYLPDSSSTYLQIAAVCEQDALFRFIDEMQTLRMKQAHNLNAQMMYEKLIVSWLALTRPRKAS